MFTCMTPIKKLCHAVTVLLTAGAHLPHWQTRKQYIQTAVSLQHAPCRREATVEDEEGLRRD